MSPPFPFLLCKIFMNAVRERLLGVCDEMSFHKEDVTPLQTAENKVSVSQKLINSVMKSHQATLSHNH